MKLRRGPQWLVALALTGMALVAGSGATAAASSSPTVVTTFPSGTFAESLTLGPDGTLYASLTTWGEVVNSGQVFRIGQNGAQRPFGPSIDVGPTALLTGVVFDSNGDLFVAAPDYGTGKSHIYLVTPKRVAVWATLPTGTFPNGVAVRDGWLYAADSYLGAIWRVPLTHPTAPTHPWYSSPLLAPSTGLGANGIAFRGSTLYLSVSDTGRIVRVPVTSSGSPGPASAVVTDQRLVTADGIAFDPFGYLWVTVNGTDPTVSGPGSVPPALVRVSPWGSVDPVVTAAAWMNYPTQPVLTPVGVFVENGAYYTGEPTVVLLTHLPATGN